MDQREKDSAGGFWGASDGYKNNYVLIPDFVDPAVNKPYSAEMPPKAGPVVITEYAITQQPGGTAICILVFDATTVPADGRAVFGVSPAPKRIIPLTGGNQFFQSLNAPWERFDTGFVAIASKDYVTIQYASEKVFFAVRYCQNFIGGIVPRVP